MNATEIKSICSQYGLTPSKSKGQNFLIEENVVAKIIAGAKLQSDDIVLEVGPGLGVLTEQLLRNAKKVIAIELD